ncbi:MAG: hypothetical protein D8H99_27435 [Streptococcus sp.]|nr:MAG: hypothetical protein D8H99_27435 [Streptococcus sp.]
MNRKLSSIYRQSIPEKSNLLFSSFDDEYRAFHSRYTEVCKENIIWKFYFVEKRLVPLL